MSDVSPEAIQRIWITTLVIYAVVLIVVGVTVAAFVGGLGTGGTLMGVGRRLKKLAAANQVLCVTHLPLIAACAEHHVAVTKRVVDGRTVSSARALEPQALVGDWVGEWNNGLGLRAAVRVIASTRSRSLKTRRPLKARRPA